MSTVRSVTQSYLSDRNVLYSLSFLFSQIQTLMSNNILCIPGKAHLSPNGTACQTPTKSHLMSLTKTMDLWDGDNNTCITPFSTTETKSYRILVELFELWRTNPVITLKGTNIPCSPAGGIYIHLLTPEDGITCSSFYPEMTSSGSSGSSGVDDICFYWCDRVTAMITYISVTMEKEIFNLSICEATIFSGY